MLNGDSARFAGEQADLWEEARSCGVCEAETWELASEVCGRRVGRCGKCGTHRLVDRVAEGQLRLLYGHYYRSADPDAANLETQLRNPTFAHRRRRLEAAVGSRQRRFFEIGCGDGNYLASCRRAGWDVAGSEFSEDTVALIRRRHDISVTMADVPIETPAGAPYPVVGAFHVFEHLYHPVEWLHAVGRMLEPAGLLHLQVPNYGSLIRLLTGAAWSAHVFPQHVYFYTPATLEVLLERTGFHPITVTTWDPWHGPGVAADSLSLGARYLVSGRLPWTAALGVPADASVATATRGPARRLAGAGLRAAGAVLARCEAVLGRGAVVDVIAEKSA